MFDKQAILVLGMGRSGTSAVARVLSLCGGGLPDLLLGATDGNPKGHWEPLEALRLNEDFLFRQGATFFDPTLRLQSELAFDEQEKETYIEKIRAFLETCPGQKPLVLKEPRITVLTDFWFEAVRRAGFALSIVVAVRHPQEVAASLATRDGASPELATALWLKYNLLAERQSRSLRRVFVEYSNLLSDWRKEIGRIAEALSLRLTDRDETAIEAFLTRDLHRERSAGPPHELFGQPWIGSVYDALSAAARGAPLDLEAMDEIFSTYSVCERTFRLSSNEFRNRFGGSPWASDLVTFLSHVQGECAVEIARRFGDAVDLRGASVETIRAEFARQVERVSDVVRNRDEAQRQLLETNTRHEQHRSEAEGRIKEFDLLTRTLSAELQRARLHAETTGGQLLDANARLAAAYAELVTTHEHVSHMQSQLAVSQAHLATSQARVAASHDEIAQLRSLAVALQTRIDTYERSHSWRLTAPLRAVRRGRRATPPESLPASLVRQLPGTPPVDAWPAQEESPVREFVAQTGPAVVAESSPAAGWQTPGGAKGSQSGHR